MKFPFASQQLFVLAIIPVIIGLYWPTISVLCGRWVEWDKGLSHGLLVAAVFIWLLWTGRSTAPPRYFVVRIIMVALASLLWFLLQSVRISVLAEVALLLVIICTFNAWFGLANSWRHKAVLVLPLFATSLWGEFNSAAVLLSGFVVGHLVDWIGITAYIDGTSITLPYGQMVIADGCSGLRYLVIALALGHMLCCLNHYSTRAYWTVMALALVLGLATNWIRIFVLVLVGYYSQMQNSLVSDHELFGWLLFAAVIFPALYFAPLKPAAIADEPQVQFPLPRLVALWAVVSLGPLLLVLGQRAPHPEPWLSPLQLQPGVAPDWSIQSPMPHAGLLEQGFAAGVWVQRWQYQRVSTGDKLVPFFGAQWPADFNCRERNVDNLGAWFQCEVNGRPLVVLRHYQVGRFATSDFRWAKLWQIPAQWMGANLFSLTQWQQHCEANHCDQAVARIIAAATIKPD